MLLSTESSLHLLHLFFKSLCAPFIFKYLSIYRYYLFVCLFLGRISLASPGYPGTLFIKKAGLELRDLRASVSWVLRWKACATMTKFFKKRSILIRVCISMSFCVCHMLRVWVPMENRKEYQITWNRVANPFKAPYACTAWKVSPLSEKPLL